MARWVTGPPLLGAFARLLYRPGMKEQGGRMITYVCELLICFRAALCENLPRVTPAQVKQPPYKNFTKRSFRASRT
eukprot:5169420-Prymnesium_polylepis.7